MSFNGQGIIDLLIQLAKFPRRRIGTTPLVIPILLIHSTTKLSSAPTATLILFGCAGLASLVFTNACGRLPSLCFFNQWVKFQYRMVRPDQGRKSARKAYFPVKNQVKGTKRTLARSSWWNSFLLMRRTPKLTFYCIDDFGKKINSF